MAAGSCNEDHDAAPRSGLTHTYLSGYASINSQQVIDPMPNAHDMLFRTLADPTRRALFERLCREGEQTVGALTARAGVSQPAVSKHLWVLKQAGLVRDRDPSRLFNSSLEGNTRRAIDFHEGDKIDEKALKALIRAAVALNTSVRATARPVRSQKRPKSA